MKVMKFGGTSVKDATSIKQSISIIEKSNENTFITVSAFATITNSLTDIINFVKIHDTDQALKKIEYIYNVHTTVAKDLCVTQFVQDYIDTHCDELRQLIPALGLLGQISPKSIDVILSYGEKLSSFIICHAIMKDGHTIAHIDTRQAIKTDSTYNSAVVDFDKTAVAFNVLCSPIFKENDFIIGGGFIASDAYGNTTTLGRGGGDYSAAIAAASLNADILQIWTDVDGIMTFDPRIIKNARNIDTLTYDEAGELAYFGAKVIHPKTIHPAVKKKIPVQIRNTFNPEHSGTTVSDESFADCKKVIKAIALQKDITVINIYSNQMLGAVGFLSKIFNIFDRNNTSVDLISTSEVNISLTIDNTINISPIISELEQFSTVTVSHDKCIISAIGEGIKYTSGVAARLFTVLAKENINVLMVSVGASDVNLGIIVEDKDKVQAVTLLHDEFFKD